MKKKQKQKNYKRRSKNYNSLGVASLLGGSLGGFGVYEMIIDWENFVSNIDNFVVVQQDTLKLNLAVAFPLLIAVTITLFLFLKRNKVYFKDKISLSILIALLVFYMMYSIIEVVVVTLAGAFIGSIMNDFLFVPLSVSAGIKAQDDKDLEVEYKKEQRRILARKKAEEELDGSV